MKTYTFGTLFLLLTACAPLAPSMPKSDLCRIQSHYDLIVVNQDSWSDVQTKMVVQPISSDGDTLVYKECGRTMTFEFSGNVLISKQIE